MIVRHEIVICRRGTLATQKQRWYAQGAGLRLISPGVVFSHEGRAMVDRDQRRQVDAALSQLLDGKMTNDEFDDLMPFGPSRRTVVIGKGDCFAGILNVFLIVAR